MVQKGSPGTEEGGDGGCGVEVLLSINREREREKGIPVEFCMRSNSRFCRMVKQEKQRNILNRKSYSKIYSHRLVKSKKKYLTLSQPKN